MLVEFCSAFASLGETRNFRPPIRNVLAETTWNYHKLNKIHNLCYLCLLYFFLHSPLDYYYKYSLSIIIIFSTFSPHFFTAFHLLVSNQSIIMLFIELSTIIIFCYRKAFLFRYFSIWNLASILVLVSIWSRRPSIGFYCRAISVI